MRFSSSLLSVLLTLVLYSCSHDSGFRLYDTVNYSKLRRESHFLVSGIPEVRKEKDVTIATIRPKPKATSYTVEWPKGSAPEPAKPYQFEFLKTELDQPPGKRPFTEIEILRIKDGEKVLLDRSICEIHRQPMIRQEEEDVSLDGYADYVRKYRRSHSPNDGKVFLACDSGISHMSWKCPSCYKISEAWAAKHPDAAR